MKVKKLLNKVNISRTLNEEHAGVVGFEYMIILVIMSVAIFAGWTSLSDQIKAKSNDVASFIGNNGQSQLGTNSSGSGH